LRKRLSTQEGQTNRRRVKLKQATDHQNTSEEMQTISQRYPNYQKALKDYQETNK
jgi:hypothetical protein